MLTERVKTMNWIESLFGVSPDGGSGMLEAVYIIVAAFTVAVMFNRISVFKRKTFSKG